MSVTLKDIAQKVGLSPTAVSHVLGNRLGKVGVSQKKQLEIRRVARELGYTPNRHARSMVTKRSHTIAVIGAMGRSQDAFGAEYFLRVMQGVERGCRERHYNCLFTTSDMMDPVAFSPTVAMRDGSLDGIILVGHTRREIVQKLRDLELRCVQVGTNIDPDLAVDSCFADLDAGFAEAAVALRELGHGQVCLLLPDGPGPRVLAKNFRCLTDPRQGFTAEATLLGRTEAGRTDYDGYVQRMAESVRSGHGPTAFITESAACGKIALGFARRGFACPADYSIIGFGTDSLLEEHLVPEGVAISTIVMPMEEVGAQAAARLLARCNDEMEHGQSHFHDVLPCRLVLQESCGPRGRVLRPRPSPSRAEHT